MKLTEDKKQRIKASWGDWESVHGLYDQLVAERLSQLDPEFYEDLQELTKGAVFWYA